MVKVQNLFQVDDLGDTLEKYHQTNGMKKEH